MLEDPHQGLAIGKINSQYNVPDIKRDAVESARIYRRSDLRFISIP